MRVPVLLRAFSVLVCASLACSVGTGGNGGGDLLPPTDTPAPTVAPSPTPEGGGVQDGFFVLNLSESDQEGLELRAEEI